MSGKPNPKTVKDVLSHSFVKEYASYLRSTGKVRRRKFYIPCESPLHRYVVFIFWFH